MDINIHITLDISIHAPVKGATPCSTRTLDIWPHYFNPRTREGCDLVMIFK